MHVHQGMIGLIDKNRSSIKDGDETISTLYYKLEALKRTVETGQEIQTSTVETVSELRDRFKTNACSLTALANQVSAQTESIRRIEHDLVTKLQEFSEVGNLCSTLHTQIIELRSRLRQVEDKNTRFAAEV